MPKNYYDHHNSDAEPHSRDRRLPGLHDVLGDVLVQPLRSPYSSQDYHDSRRITPRDDPRHHAGPQLVSAPHPPVKQRSSTPHASNSFNTQTPTTASQHAYHLFNYSPNQGLVHRRTSTQEQDLEPSQPRPRLPPSDPARKHACPDCGNRFSKHSTLRNHLLTHSGEKPFECTHPGCGRRFSMACNMQRHLRTHTSASAFSPSPEADPYSRSRTPSMQPSSHRDSRASSMEYSSRGGSPRLDPARGYGYKR